jgi:hypothetical protein
MGCGQLAAAANVVDDDLFLPVDVYDAALPQSFGLPDQSAIARNLGPDSLMQYLGLDDRS